MTNGKTTYCSSMSRPSRMKCVRRRLPPPEKPSDIGFQLPATQKSDSLGQKPTKEEEPPFCLQDMEPNMRPLRKKRLLLLATRPAHHKRWYSQYCILIREGLVDWSLGTAFLTSEGEKELCKNSKIDWESYGDDLLPKKGQRWPY